MDEKNLTKEKKHRNRPDLEKFGQETMRGIYAMPWERGTCLRWTLMMIWLWLIEWRGISIIVQRMI